MTLDEWFSQFIMEYSQNRGLMIMPLGLGKIFHGLFKQYGHTVIARKKYHA